MDNIFNINFPLIDSDMGYLVDLTKNSSDGILADIKHLLLTTRGSRYYRPSFGASLKKNLFEPNDEFTHNTIKTEINDILTTYFPTVKIKGIEIITSDPVSNLFNENLRGVRTSSKTPNPEHIAKIRITLQLSESTFENTKIIELNF